MEEWVDALQMAIEQCLDAEAKFQKAAYYDAQKYLAFERTQRSAYVDKVKFNQSWQKNLELDNYQFKNNNFILS